MSLIYSLKHREDFHVEIAPCQHSVSPALQEDGIPENQTNIYLREGTLSSKLTKWVKRPGGLSMEEEFCFKLKKRSESFLQMFAEGSGLMLSAMTF